MGLLTGSTTFLFGFTAGFGTGWIAHDLLPDMRVSARPVLRTLRTTLMRSGDLVSDRSRELGVRLGELFRNTLAELNERHSQAKPAAVHKRHKKSAGVSKRAIASGAKTADGSSNVVYLRKARGSKRS